MYRYFLVGSKLDPGKGYILWVSNIDKVEPDESVKHKMPSSSFCEQTRTTPTDGSSRCAFSASNSRLSSSVGLNFFLGAAKRLRDTINSLILGDKGRKYEKNAALDTASALLCGNSIPAIFSTFSGANDCIPEATVKPKILQ